MVVVVVGIIERSRFGLDRGRRFVSKDFIIAIRTSLR